MPSMISKHSWLIAPIISVLTIIVTLAVGWSSLQARASSSEKIINEHELKVRQLEISQAEIQTSLKYILEGLGRIETKLDKKVDK